MALLLIRFSRFVIRFFVFDGNCTGSNSVRETACTLQSLVNRKSMLQWKKRTRKKQIHRPVQISEKLFAHQIDALIYLLEVNNTLVRSNDHFIDLIFESNRIESSRILYFQVNMYQCSCGRIFEHHTQA